MTPHVFISFASADASLARRAVAALEAAGIRCWLCERDIEPAASYPAAITAAVTTSGALLLLLTEAANGSPHVAREVELAFSSRRPILPVRIGAAVVSADLQYFLSRSQWLNVGEALDDEELARIEGRLHELLRGQGGAAPGGEHRAWVRFAVVASTVVVIVLVVLVWNNRRVDDPRAGGQTAAAPAGPAPAPSAPPAPAQQVRLNTHDGQPYVWVPPGQFVMGCSAGDPACDADESPTRLVTIRRGFWLGRTETIDTQYQRGAHAGTMAAAAPTSALPATGVSWAAAKAYCEAIGGRLPTEAEWEFAARAGTATRYYGDLQAIAWFDGNSDGRPHPVGSKAPNALGLHDMLGNVAEWVLDRYYNTYDDADEGEAIEQPLAANASGVARGGSWLSDAEGVRVSRRLAMPPDAEEPHIGFRCALDQAE